MKRFFACFLACLLLIPLASCGGIGGGNEKYTAYTLDYFDTVTTVIGYADSKEAFDLVANDIFATLRRYHELFSIYDSVDGINNLKTLNEERSAVISEELFDFLEYGKAMYEKTDRRMNIGMGAVLSLWHKAREEGLLDPVRAALPDEEALREASLHCDLDALVIDRQTMTATLTDDKMLLDVGALGKGYAVEMAAKQLEEAGITGYILNAGGNVRTVGTRADGSFWLVGVEDPNREGEYLSTVPVADASLVTSGSYMRYYYVKGKAYHHIISPDTLMPSEFFVSLTVLCRDSAEADALSTALFTVSYEEGLRMLENFPDAEVLWLFPDGEIRTTEGWQGEM